MIFANEIRNRFVAFPCHCNKEGPLGIFYLVAFKGFRRAVFGAEVAGPEVSWRLARGGNPLVQRSPGCFRLAMLHHSFDYFHVHWVISASWLIFIIPKDEGRN